MKLITADLFSAYSAYHNCLLVAHNSNSDNHVWLQRWQDRIYDTLNTLLPHGSGIDSAWTYSLDNPNYIIAYNSFHLMNADGYYVEWLDFTIAITPDLNFTLTIISPDEYDTKEYLDDTITECLDDYKRTLEALNTLRYYTPVQLFALAAEITLNPEYTFDTELASKWSLLKPEVLQAIRALMIY